MIWPSVLSFRSTNDTEVCSCVMANGICQLCE
jgi:hypothetical protein